MAGGWKSRNRKKQDGMQAGACADGALSQPRVAGALPASEVASCRAEAESLAEEAAAGGSGECLAAKVQELQRRIEALEGAATARPYPQEQDGSIVVLAPLGHIRSPHKQRHGTPRQAVVGDDGGSEPDAELVLCDGITPDSLTGLEGFDFAWLIYDFNRNRQLGVNNFGGLWKSVIRPPPSLTFDYSAGRGGVSGSLPAPVLSADLPRSRARSRRADVRVGVLATRSPNRPNMVGLSAVRILSVDAKAGVVKFRGIDLLDGTPVFDIKPYLAYVDSFPDARQGWTVYPSPKVDTGVNEDGAAAAQEGD